MKRRSHRCLPEPLPVITPLNKPFWDYALKSVFALQVCARCGDAHLPPSPVCPKCLSDRPGLEARLRPRNAEIVGGFPSRLLGWL